MKVKKQKCQCDEVFVIVNGMQDRIKKLECEHDWYVTWFGGHINVNLRCDECGATKDIASRKANKYYNKAVNIALKELKCQ